MSSDSDSPAADLGRLRKLFPTAPRKRGGAGRLPQASARQGGAEERGIVVNESGGNDREQGSTENEPLNEPTNQGDAVASVTAALLDSAIETSMAESSRPHVEVEAVARPSESPAQGIAVALDSPRSASADTDQLPAVTCSSPLKANEVSSPGVVRGTPVLKGIGGPRVWPFDTVLQMSFVDVKGKQVSASVRCKWSRARTAKSECATSPCRRSGIWGHDSPRMRSRRASLPPRLNSREEVDTSHDIQKQNFCEVTAANISTLQRHLDEALECELFKKEVTSTTCKPLDPADLFQSLLQKADALRCAQHASMKDRLLLMQSVEKLRQDISSMCCSITPIKSSSAPPGGKDGTSRGWPLKNVPTPLRSDSVSTKAKNPDTEISTARGLLPVATTWRASTSGAPRPHVAMIRKIEDLQDEVNRYCPMPFVFRRMEELQEEARRCGDAWIRLLHQAETVQQEICLVGQTPEVFLPALAFANARKPRALVAVESAEKVDPHDIRATSSSSSGCSDDDKEKISSGRSDATSCGDDMAHQGDRAGSDIISMEKLKLGLRRLSRVESRKSRDVAAKVSTAPAAKANDLKLIIELRVEAQVLRELKRCRSSQRLRAHPSSASSSASFGSSSTASARSLSTPSSAASSASSSAEQAHSRTSLWCW